METRISSIEAGRAFSIISVTLLISLGVCLGREGEFLRSEALRLSNSAGRGYHMGKKILVLEEFTHLQPWRPEY